MEQRQQNRLNMIAACLSAANSDEHKSTWENKPPTAFTAEMTVLASLYEAARVTAQKIETPVTGVTLSKADAETLLEDRAIAIAGPLRYHFMKTADMENHAKVNYTDSGIRGLRQQLLITTTRIIRDCGTLALTHADATAHGITTAKVTALTVAIDAFDALLAAPRTMIGDRSVFVRELVTDLAGCTAQLEMMDDLILAFAGTPAGDHFIAAWNQARIIVDAGGGPGEDPASVPGVR